MIKRLLILSLCLFLCLPALAGAENLILNPDFEDDFESDGAAYWSSEAWHGWASDFDVQSIDGERCLHISSDENNDARWIQTIEVEPDTVYRFSAYVMAKSCSYSETTRGANISINGAGPYSDSVYDTDGQWEYVEMYGVTGPEQYELTIALRIGGFSGDGTGEAWFRQVSFEEAELPDGVLLNSFEAAEQNAADYSWQTDGYDEDEPPERKTKLWLAAALIFVLLFVECLLLCKWHYERRARLAIKRPIRDVLAEICGLLVVLMIASGVRYWLTGCIRGYKNDMDCFQYWGILFREKGFGFYANASFHDYPPLYMMILGGVDWFRELFGIDPYSSAHDFLIKIVPMMSDLLTALIIYAISRRRLGALKSVLLAALIALNPAYIMDSAAWGQIDSFLTLLIVLSVLFGMKGMWYLALPFYAFAILTKPQALMFGPIGLVCVIAACCRKPRKLLNALIGLVLTLAILAGVSLPFALNEFPWSQEYSVVGELKAESVDSSYNIYTTVFTRARADYLQWYDEHFAEGAETLPDAETLETAEQKQAFDELSKAAAFIAEYYLQTRQSKSFDDAVGEIESRHGSQTVFWEYLRAEKLKNWDAMRNGFEQILQDGGELSDAQWLLLQMYDNIMDAPGLNAVLQSKPVPGKTVYLLTWLWNKLMGTAQSYEYFSINACNLYVLLDKNWTPLINDYSPEHMRHFAWFMVYAAYVYAAMIAVGRNKKKKKAANKRRVSGSENLALAGAVLIGILFCFAPMMHERYLFPAIALSLLAYWQHRDRRLVYYCGLITLTQFLNIALVLEWGGYSGLGNLQQSEQTVNHIISALNLFATLYLCWTAFDITLGWKIKKPLCVPGYRIGFRFVAAIGVVLVTLVYAVIAFVNLGEMNSPVTFYKSSEKNEQIVFDLGEVKTYRLTYYGGISNAHFNVALSNDGENWTEDNAAEYAEGSMYRWIWYEPKNYVNNTFTTVMYPRRTVDTGDGGAKVTYAKAPNSYPTQTSRYVRFTVADEKYDERYYSTVATQKLLLYEVAFIDVENGTLLSIASVTGDVEGADYGALVDEQDRVSQTPSYFNGMYFDEIYHARTAYELLNGYESNHILEWSHPHLGKLLIAIGIKLFGMTPFGWRFSGALIGVLMLPLFYLFVRQLGGKRSVAFVAMLLLTFDSMHFTQTRIATVDSYAVFFILLMYLFMIRYFRMDLLKEKPWKALLTLTLSGVSMGLACASKWTGVYASAGLALIFFIKTGLTVWDYRKLRREGLPDSSPILNVPRNTVLTLDWCCIVFVAVPVLIYYFSYYWHFASSSGLSFEKVWQLQQQMYNYHSTIVDNHYFKSPWYEWPVIAWPMWYYSADRAFVGENMVSSISLMGNPAVWWTGLVGLVSCTGIFLMQKKKDVRLLLVILGFASQYLPWVLVPRSTYIYHYFASVPFMIAAIALALEYLSSRYRVAARVTAIVLVVAAAGLFALFYPLESGLPASYNYVEKLRWFDWYNFAPR